ncbi:MAG TPA: glycosyltransferase [Catalimonadaceae bacterium]|jgi:glycosyltransferase involved in cell wall biosynthesis|nr:glycosyltransferase [Catalimonadaceae bacterium]
MSKKFSLVTTVFNEIKRLDQTIADIEGQSLKPDEILIADAGSTDGTLERLRQWKDESSIAIQVFVKQGCNIAEGRNEAIRRASHELIVSTDFGCRYKTDWLKSLIDPFSDPEVEVVGGAFSIIPEEVNTQAAKADFVLQNGYPIDMGPDFSTSSRSIAYYRYVWEKIGGYQEWLTLAADDTIFWRQIKQHHFRYKLVPEPNVYWLRHKTLKAFSKEAYRYGLGDGESGINFKNMVSHVFETACRYAFFLVLIYLPLILVSGAWLMGFILVPLSFGLRSYKNAWKNWRNLKMGYGPGVLFTAFRLIELSRWQYLKGYFKGWLFPKPGQTEGRNKLEGII